MVNVISCTVWIRCILLCVVMVCIEFYVGCVLGRVGLDLIAIGLVFFGYSAYVNRVFSGYDMVLVYQSYVNKAMWLMVPIVQCGSRRLIGLDYISHLGFTLGV